MATLNDSKACGKKKKQAGIQISTKTHWDTLLCYTFKEQCVCVCVCVFGKGGNLFYIFIA